MPHSRQAGEDGSGAAGWVVVGGDAGWVVVGGDEVDVGIDSVGDGVGSAGGVDSVGVDVDCEGAVLEATGAGSGEGVGNSVALPVDGGGAASVILPVGDAVATFDVAELATGWLHEPPS